MKKLLLTALLIVCALSLLLAAFLRFSRRVPMPAAGTLSYELLQPGPFEVATETFQLVDPTRTIPSLDDPGASSQRGMPVRLWYPDSDEHSPKPLLIYSHGFMSTGEGVAFIARILASQGYVIAAPDFPITSRRRGEQAESRDVIKQPRDVALLLDTLLTRSQDDGDILHDRIDPSRIAALGYSLGALHTLLLGFHPTMQEPRIQAVVSLAGPSEVFTRKFLNTRSIPFMAIAATDDSFVDYEANFASLRDKTDDAILVTFHGASHLGFADEGKWFRWFEHADTVGCTFAKATIDRNRKSTEPWYDELGGIEEGYVQEIDPEVCEREYPAGMNPLRQQQLTLMAVRSFLACQFEQAPSARDRWCTYLEQTFKEENKEVSIQGQAPPPQPL